MIYSVHVFQVVPGFVHQPRFFLGFDELSVVSYSDDLGNSLLHSYRTKVFRRDLMNVRQLSVVHTYLSKKPFKEMYL